MSSSAVALARGGAFGLAMTLAACSGRAAPGPGDVSELRLAVAPSRDLTSHYGDYLAGNFARDIGEVTAAAGYFERALAGSPGNVDLLEELFLLNVAAGRFDQALAQAEDLVEVRPDSDEARLMLAARAVRAGQAAEARAQLSAVGERGIAALATPFLDAWSIFQDGGPAAVDQAIRRLQEAEPLGPLNDYHIAMLQHLGGRTAQGLEVLKATAESDQPVPSRMAQAYAAMLAAGGARADAVSFLEAQVVDALEQPHIERSLEVLRGGGPPLLPFDGAIGGMADALLGIAEALHQERGGSRAIFYARTAQFLAPDLDDAMLLVGDIMAAQDNQEAAIEAYQRVAGASPLHYAARLRVAQALYNLERHDDAFDTLEDLGERSPQRVDALVQLGDMLRREEEYERAERAYSRAIERLGEIGSEHWSLFYTRGIARERIDRWPEAEADFLRALELQPEQPFVLNYLGYSWVDMGMHFDRAKEMLVRAVELRPNDGFIVDSLGWVHYRLGEFSKAVEQLERAVELEPGDPVINDHLGDAYWRVGRTREARYQWERALTLEPEDDLREAVEEKLENGLPARDDALIDRT